MFYFALYATIIAAELITLSSKAIRTKSMLIVGIIVPTLFVLQRLYSLILSAVLYSYSYNLPSSFSLVMMIDSNIRETSIVSELFLREPRFFGHK